MNFEIAPKSTEIEANWYDAKLYCFSLNIDGKTGWRLPTLDELNNIRRSRNDFELWYYWSSTERDGNYAWAQHFRYGYQGNDGKNYGNKEDGNCSVRAIRDLP